MIDDGRIPTHIRVMANVRRCNSAGMPTVVVRKGDPGSGVVMLKLTRRPPTGGFGFADREEPLSRVLTETRDMDGKSVWFAARDGSPMTEADADAYISRSVQRDPDLWVVAIETPDDSNPFDGPDR